jgi:hypothetical protein
VFLSRGNTMHNQLFFALLLHTNSCLQIKSPPSQYDIWWLWPWYCTFINMWLKRNKQNEYLILTPPGLTLITWKFLIKHKSHLSSNLNPSTAKHIWSNSWMQSQCFVKKTLCFKVVLNNSKLVVLTMTYTLYSVKILEYLMFMDPCIIIQIL